MGVCMCIPPARLTHSHARPRFPRAVPPRRCFPQFRHPAPTLLALSSCVCGWREVFFAHAEAVAVECRVFDRCFGLFRCMGIATSGFIKRTTELKHGATQSCNVSIHHHSLRALNPVTLSSTQHYRISSNRKTSPDSAMTAIITAHPPP